MVNKLLSLVNKYSKLSNPNSNFCNPITRILATFNEEIINETIGNNIMIAQNTSIK
ncbi:Hypothetical protein MCYN_0075 [Mycoplasmopsis cynos C142]|uniref:Uncharacterized protein n=1 Tax=Mycoplasmopsis cynos (strain C142) TaxID=1246955 RepID=L0RUZ8_MYCC1|nr:Hypothetical protein MCYN_0075 [Mycoplasmopsis cynos C142]